MIEFYTPGCGDHGDALAAEPAAVRVLLRTVIHAGGAVVHACSGADLPLRLRMGAPGRVHVLSARYLDELGVPEWLVELPALGESRLLLHGAVDGRAPVLRAWAAAVDAVVVVAGELAPWPDAVAGVHVAATDAVGAVAFVGACAPSAPAAEPEVRALSHCVLPTHYGDLDVTAYAVDGEESALLVAVGDLAAGDAALVRVHSECFTGEVLASLKCDCDGQLRHALRAIADRGRGAVVYLRQEGRGIGLANKIAAYSEQQRGADTIEANRRLGFPADLRDFSVAAALLRAHGVRRVELLTNNPAKVRTLRRQGITVQRVAPTVVEPNPHSVRYLQVKYEALGHVGLRDVVPAKVASPRAGAQLVVFDLDGVIQFGKEVPDAAIAMVQAVRAAGHCVRFLTNDGYNSRASRQRELAAAGLRVADEEIYTASYLAARFVAPDTPTLALAGPPGVDELTHLPRAGDDARVVLVGDWFSYYDRDLLQRAFTALQRGAELIAMHRKRHWFARDDQRIDVGFFVAGLEYCTHRPATVVGKPAAFAYETVRRDAGFAAHQAIMVSDEVDPDLQGARRLGWRTVHFGARADGPPDACARDHRALQALLLRSLPCPSS